MFFFYSRIWFSCCLQSRIVPQLFWSFMTLPSTVQLPCNMYSILIRLMFSPDEIQTMHFRQEYHRSSVVLFSVHHIRGHMISICLMIGNLNFDHIVKWGFSPTKVFFSPILWGYTLRICNILSQHVYLHNFSIYWWFLSTQINSVYQLVISIFTIPFTLIN